MAIKYMTWQDIKLATLQKMFTSKGLTIQLDGSNEEYINSMPQACNEALQLLSTSGKFIIEQLQVVVAPIPNLLMDGVSKRNYTIINDSVSFTAKGAKSFYFKANGILTAHIYVGDTEYTVTASTEDETDIPVVVNTKSFDAFRGRIENPDNLDVTITFTSTYPSNIKNIALYAADFPSDKEVQDFEDYLRYDLTELAEDFYQLDSGEIY